MMVRAPSRCRVTCDIARAGSADVSDQRAYLSVLAWPEGMDEAARTEALVATVGLDPYNAR